MTDPVREMLAQAFLLKPKERRELHRQLCRLNLSDRERQDIDSIAEKGGRQKDGGSLALTRILDAEDSTGLTPEFVRAFIYAGLELCPTDYCQVSPDGDWCVDPAAFDALPRAVRMLVQSMEMKYVGGVPVFKVNFVSKDALIRLAAQYTLTSRIAVAQVQVPWEKFAEVAAEDRVERHLAALESGAA